MNIVSFIYAFLLFFLLTPGILVVLPKKGKKIMVAGVHALIFSLVFVLTNPWLVKNTHFMFEGFKEGAAEAARVAEKMPGSASGKAAKLVEEAQAAGGQRAGKAK